VGQDAEYLARHILGTGRQELDARAKPPAGADSRPWAQVDEIARFARAQVVPSGALVVKQGDYARDFYVIAGGTAHVRRDGEHVATLSQGQFFGEVGLLETSWRQADVVAATPMELLVVEPRDFQLMMGADQELAARVYATATARS
jgi:voltage-gated potassium channel